LIQFILRRREAATVLALHALQRIKQATRVPVVGLI